MAYKYLKNHSELLGEVDKSFREIDPLKKLKPKKTRDRKFLKKKSSGLRRLLFRDGNIIFKVSKVVVEIIGAKLVINLGIRLRFLAKNRALTGLVIAFVGIAIKKIPQKALTYYQLHIAILKISIR